MIYNTCAGYTERIVELAQKATPSAPLAPHPLYPAKPPPFLPSPHPKQKGNRHGFSFTFEKSISVAHKNHSGVPVSALICASHCLTCVAGAKRKPERIGGTKRGALVPRRQPSPRSVVFRHRPENKVFRLVARQNPFTEGVLAAPPVPLKVKATDTAHIYPMKSQYRLPIKIIQGALLRQTSFLYRRNRLFA